MTTPSSGASIRAELERRVEQLEQRVAQMATEAASDREKMANLEIALATARRIGYAVGILMERHKITDEQAFDLLRIESQRRHRKLREIADYLILTGTLDIRSR